MQVPSHHASAPTGAGSRLPGTPEPMRYWTGSSGNRLAGDHWGDPNGPLVVLQHGGGQTRHAWKHAGEQLGFAVHHRLDDRGQPDAGERGADRRLVAQVECDSA